MQYVINVSGNVENIQNKSYVVNSKSEEEAKNTAIRNFCEDFSTSSDQVYVKQNRRTYKSMLAFAFMLIPILLSFVQWKNGHETISISPNYISCLYSVILYLAFVVRFKGVQRTVSTFTDILFCIFNILLFSSFVRTIIFNKAINIFGLIKFDIDTNIVLIIAMLLSWIGLRGVSLTCIGGVALLALINITDLNIAMGTIYGPMYIICSFIGMMLYISVEPAAIEALPYIKNITKRGIQYLNQEKMDIKKIDK